jgi:hypothetical protein
MEDKVERSIPYKFKCGEWPVEKLTNEDRRVLYTTMKVTAHANEVLKECYQAKRERLFAWNGRYVLLCSYIEHVATKKERLRDGTLTTLWMLMPSLARIALVDHEARYYLRCVAHELGMLLASILRHTGMWKKPHESDIRTWMGMISENNKKYVRQVVSLLSYVRSKYLDPVLQAQMYRNGIKDYLDDGAYCDMMEDMVRQHAKLGVLPGGNVPWKLMAEVHKMRCWIPMGIQSEFARHLIYNPWHSDTAIVSLLGILHLRSNDILMRTQWESGWVGLLEKHVEWWRPTHVQSVCGMYVMYSDRRAHYVVTGPGGRSRLVPDDRAFDIAQTVIAEKMNMCMWNLHGL